MEEDKREGDWDENSASPLTLSLSSPVHSLPFSSILAHRGGRPHLSAHGNVSTVAVVVSPLYSSLGLFV